MTENLTKYAIGIYTLGGWRREASIAFLHQNELQIIDDMRSVKETQEMRI